jgi:hypothetical protein
MSCTLVCVLSPTTIANDDNCAAAQVLLRPDPDKPKSVAWLDPPPTAGYHTVTTKTGCSDYGQLPRYPKDDNDNAQDATATAATIAPPQHNASYECRLFVPTQNATISPVFFVAGFVLVSNAIHVKVYLTEAATAVADTKSTNAVDTAESNIVVAPFCETYLTTVRGLQVTAAAAAAAAQPPPPPPCDNDDTLSTMAWKKSQCVFPGGPRPVHAVRLEFVLLPPKAEQHQATTTTPPLSLHLQYIRWTVRCVVDLVPSVVPPVALQTTHTEATALAHTHSNSNGRIATMLAHDSGGATLAANDSRANVGGPSDHHHDNDDDDATGLTRQVAALSHQVALLTRTIQQQRDDFVQYQVQTSAQLAHVTQQLALVTQLLSTTTTPAASLPWNQSTPEP